MLQPWQTHLLSAICLTADRRWIFYQTENLLVYKGKTFCIHIVKLRNSLVSYFKELLNSSYSLDLYKRHSRGSGYPDSSNNMS